MLILDASPKVWRTHEPTGCRFRIKPLLPEENKKLLKRCRDPKNQIDPIKHNGLVVDHAVVEWEGVGLVAGPAACDTANKTAFGEKFPGIANWVYDQATDPALFLEEIAEGKDD